MKNNKVNRYISCIGVQSEISIDIKIFFESADENFFNYVIKEFTDINHFLKEINSSPIPNIIIMSFCDLDFSTDIYHEYISTVKGYDAFSSTPLVGVFKNMKCLNEKSSLFGTGVNYAHILGNDMKQFFANIYYLSFEDESFNRLYATAKGFSIEHKLQALVYISQISEDSLIIDSDLNSKDESVSAEINLFEDFKTDNLPIIESFQKGKVFNTFYSDLLKIPFSSEWEDEVIDNKLKADTYETWLNMNDDIWSSRNKSILFYTKSLCVLSLTCDLLAKHSSINISTRQSFNPDDKELYKLKIPIIFFHISSEESYNELDLLINELSYTKDSYNPIVVIFNSKSSADALKKVYNYNTLLVTEKEPNIEDLNYMLNLVKNTEGTNSIHLPKNDVRLVAKYNIDAIMTSITENEITFKSYIEIPMYSILKLSIPIEMYLLVIPSFRPLSPLPGGHHYQSIIMGISDASSTYLRKYVNTLISKKPQEWIHLDFGENTSNTQSEKTEKAEQIPERENYVENEQKEVVKEQVKSNLTMRERSKGLKSKL